MELITDSGVSKTLINYNHWQAIKSQTDLVKTSKGFRPYGTAYKLPIIGRAHVTLTAEAGAKITTWVYVVIQKRIRETIKNCPNAVHIKDDIVVQGTRDNHGSYLRQTLATLQ
jgi:hypothetical protein